MQISHFLEKVISFDRYGNFLVLGNVVSFVEREAITSQFLLAMDNYQFWENGFHLFDMVIFHFGGNLNSIGKKEIDAKFTTFQ